MIGSFDVPEFENSTVPTRDFLLEVRGVRRKGRRNLAILLQFADYYCTIALKPQFSLGFQEVATTIIRRFANAGNFDGHTLYSTVPTEYDC